VVTPRRGGALALVALLAWTASASAQPLTIAVAGDALKVRAPGWPFLTAEPLARLKEGRTVRVELTVLALPAPGKAPAATIRQIFSVSYDLWEERLAVTTTGAHAAAVSHLTAAAAEAWCIEQLAVPIASLAGVADQRFWIRLECRILDADGASGADEDAGLTLQRLIDLLSRRRAAEPPARVLDGGPFRLPARGGGPASPR
jgi:hypothetical protein